MEEQEDKLVQMGDDAEQLLSSEAFTNTINSLVDAQFQTFGNTKPEDWDKREMAYHHYRALIDIVSTLQQRVAIKDEIVTKADDDNNQEEEE
jgi:hypothetical protein